MKKIFSGGRFVLALFGGCLFVGLMCLGPVENNSSTVALSILSTALSILAGILLTIIAVVGNPRNLYLGSWRIANMHKRQICRVLTRSAMLFSLYILVITLAFGSILIEAYVPFVVGIEWAKHIALSVGSVALLWSFSLPWIIRKVQLERLDDEVQKRRNQGQEISDSEREPA